MLDVHAPHETAHTWKDFFLHVATICVGLLIAIGLEQTVEWLHQIHERRELIAELHAESIADLPVIQSNLAYYRVEHVWERASIAALQRATPSAGFVSVTLPQCTYAPGTVPVPRSVWLLAKSSGRAALLPEQLGEFFDLVDRLAEKEQEAFDRKITTSSALDAIAVRLPGQPAFILPAATLRLSLQQRDDLVIAFSNDAVAMDMTGRWLTYWNDADTAELNGVHRPQDFRFPHQYLNRDGGLNQP